jgi:PAS domain S-box-containing protein
VILRKKIFWRISLLLLFLILLITGSLSGFIIHENRVESKRLHLVLAKVISDGLQREILWDDRVAVQNLLAEQIEDHDHFEYIFVVRDGHLYATGPEKKISSGLLVPPKADKTGAYVWEFRDRYGAVHYDVVCPIGRTGAVLRVGLSRSQIDQDVYPIIVVIVLVGFIAFLAGLYLAHRVAFRATAEISLLCDTIRSFGVGDENKNSDPLDTSTEVAELARSFRVLAADSKRFEQALKRSEAHLRAVVQTIPDLVWLKDPDGVYLACNPKFEMFFGAAEADIMGKTDYDFVDKELADFFREHDLKAIEADGPSVNEETLTFAETGYEGLFETIKTPMVDEKGNLIGVLGISRDISERKQAEQAIKENEARFRGMFDHMSSGVAIYKAVDDGDDFVFLDFNPAAERIEKIARKEVIGRRLTEAFPMAVEIGIFEVFQRVWRTGESEKFPITFYEDGRVKGWRENYIYRLSSGEVIAVYDDRTEQKKAELARELAHDFLQTVIDGFPGSIMVINRDYTVALANRTAQEVGKRIGEDTPRQKCHCISHGSLVPCGSDKHPCPMEQVLKTRSVVTVEHIHSDAEGQDVPVEVVAAPIFDANGEIMQIIETSFDITERKHAEAEKYRLLAAINQAAEIIVITDVDGIIEYVNPAFEQTTGYTREEALGQKPSILQSGEQDEAFYQEIWIHLLKGETWSGRFVNRKKDATLYTEDATISPVKNSTGEIVNYVAVKRDVTDELNRDEQLRQSQKMESIGQLVGGVAHDFNNILQIINGCSEIALQQLASDHSSASNIREVLKAGGNAQKLVKQLLAFSRQEVIDPEEFDLNSEILSGQKMLSRIIGEHIQFQFVSGKGVGKVFLDKGQINQVLMNLCVNARDAMPYGGDLTIETNDIQIGSDDLKAHGVVRPGRYVLLSVSDTGCGMDKETCEKIFDPFFTTKEVGEGTGLGLSTVYGIIQQNRGHISVYSEQGKGSVFKIYLPVSARSANTDLFPEEHAPPEGGRETILVAEDDQTILKLAAQVLTRSGYTVLTASDGVEALQVFEEHSQVIDLVVTDVVMPRMGGKEVIEQMLKKRPALHHLFVSGYSQDAGHTDFIKEKGRHLLSKPYSSDVLLKTIRDILDEEKA